jgi:uncharacterized membrane protein
LDVEFADSGASGRLLRVKLDFLTWFVCAFATYRLTVLISRDIGPFGVFAWGREHSKMLKCPYCTGIYVGALTALCLYWSGLVMPLGMWIIISLSFSAAAVILDRCFTSDYFPK